LLEPEPEAAMPIRVISWRTRTWAKSRSNAVKCAVRARAAHFRGLMGWSSWHRSHYAE
jgi:hypothetical protein